jgi:sugar-specific transcriptional regulator TrmB
MYLELEKIGLDKDEAKVYLALLDLGDTTAGPVVKHTMLHRQTVYDTIEKLKRRDLVSETVIKNRKRWLALSPTRILDTIKRQEFIVENILPDLLARQRISNKKQEVRVYEGAEGLITKQLESYKNQPRDSEVCVLGATPRYWIEVMRSTRRMKSHERVRIERQIKMRLLFSEHKRAETEELVARHVTKKPEERLRKYRFLSSAYHFPTLLLIWHDHLTIVLYDEPLLTIDIKNANLADSFRVYFDILWKQGKK